MKTILKFVAAEVTRRRAWGLRKAPRPLPFRRGEGRGEGSPLCASRCHPALEIGVLQRFKPFLACLALAACSARAQFVLNSIPDLPGVHSGSVAWADYDNDGRLDF